MNQAANLRDRSVYSRLRSQLSYELRVVLVQAGRNNPPVKIFPLPPLLPLLPLLSLLSALVENFCRTGLAKVHHILNYLQELA